MVATKESRKAKNREAQRKYRDREKKKKEKVDNDLRRLKVVLRDIQTIANVEGLEHILTRISSIHDTISLEGLKSNTSRSPVPGDRQEQLLPPASPVQNELQIITPGLSQSHLSMEPDPFFLMPPMGPEYYFQDGMLPYWDPIIGIGGLQQDPTFPYYDELHHATAFNPYQLSLAADK
jgi:hypothetical protein